MHHQAPANFVFLVEIGFHYVGQTGLELLTSSNPPALVFQNVGITGISHGALPECSILDLPAQLTLQLK